MTSAHEDAKPNNINNTANSHNPSSADQITVSNVAEIFNAAGFAFKKLGELVQQLDMGPTDAPVASSQQVNGVANGGGSNLSHWEPSDVEHFQSIVNSFNDELTKLSNNLKNKMSARLQAEHSEKVANRASDVKLE